MQRLEVSGAVRLIYKSLGVKRLMRNCFIHIYGCAIVYILLITEHNRLSHLKKKDKHCTVRTNVTLRRVRVTKVGV